MTQILVPICLYCLKWRKFDKLFLREFITIDATRCLDFSSKCMKMRLAAGLRPDPLEELKRSPRPPSRKKEGLLLRGREGREGGEGEGRRGEGRGRGREGRGGEGGRRGGEGRGGKGRSVPPHF